MTADDQTPASLEKLGYRDDHEYLRICNVCYELREEGRPDGQNQRCGCMPHDEERWPGHDLNQRALLCRCCALEVIPSGSRWSQYFCRECQLLAMGADVWNHRIIFPIGRHTIMNSFLPDTPAANLPGYGGDEKALAEGVYDALTAVISGGDVLWQWYPIVMRRNLEQLGLTGGVSLRDYISAVHKAEMSVLMSRIEAFDGLCWFVRFGVPPQEPVDPDS